MSWLLFLEEPGDHQSGLPYGILAGVAVEDVHVWDLIRRLRDAQFQYFGQQLVDDQGRYFGAEAFFGDDALLSASQVSGTRLRPVDHQADRIAKLNSPTAASPIPTKAKMAYCQFALSLAIDYDATGFAVFIPREYIQINDERYLRKDYSFLFERFFNFLKITPDAGAGMFVLPKFAHHKTYVTPDTIYEYFTKTTNGRLRSRVIIPTMFRADGAMGVLSQLAEIFSYIASWTVRLPHMTEPTRDDLKLLASMCVKMRFSYLTENGKTDWSFKFVDNLSYVPRSPGTRRLDHL